MYAYDFFNVTNVRKRGSQKFPRACFFSLQPCYEYEMNVLSDASDKQVCFHVISTVVRIS